MPVFFFFKQSFNRFLKEIILIGMCTKLDLGIFAPAETSVTLKYLGFCKCFSNRRKTTEALLKVPVLACVQCTGDRPGFQNISEQCNHFLIYSLFHFMSMWHISQNMAQQSESYKPTVQNSNNNNNNF